MILTQEKRKTLSGIWRDIGQVILASILIDPLMNGRADLLIFAGGLIFSLLSWYLSLYLTKDSI